MNDADLTGQSSITKNVTASYAGHLVFIILGFLMPRIIDAHVGQEGLGVWDFSWSFVSYLSLSMVGIGSSVNRFVAKFRSANNLVAMNRLVSSVIAIQIAIAFSVFLTSIALFFVVGAFFSETLGELTGTASWVVVLLGTSLAVQMAFDTWRGVLSGCHRWDYYNAINAGGYAVTAVCMIAVLHLGYGLKGIASTYLVATIAIEIVRYNVARKVCPEIVLSVAAVNRSDAKIAFRFGIKTIILAMPGILVTQTVNLFIVANLGPAVLAMLARPLSLIQHVSTLVNKYSFVLTPMAGSFQDVKKACELREFSLDHARIGWILAIIPLSYLFVFGDVVLGLWMGADYATWKITAMLSAGYVIPISQSPVLRILVGIDAHGKVAVRSAVIALIILLIGVSFATVYGWSKEIAAGIISLTVGLGTGMTVFICGLKNLHWNIVDYLRYVGVDAVKLLISLLLSLGLTRYFTEGLHVSIIFASSTAVVLAVVGVLQRNDIARFLNSFSSGKKR